MQRAGLLRQMRGVVRRILIVIRERYACALRRLYCLARAYMRVSYLVHAFLCQRVCESHILCDYVCLSWCIVCPEAVRMCGVCRHADVVLHGHAIVHADFAVTNTKGSRRESELPSSEGAKCVVIYVWRMSTMPRL
jgi:hypothetical protein